MLFFTDKTTVRVRNALLIAGLFLVIGSACGLFGCQTSPRPGEATITGGTASASRYENGGWSFRTLPTPAPAPFEKTGPWVLILHPLPQDPAKVPAAIKAGEASPVAAAAASASSTPAPSAQEPRTP